jgi:hypothetical protein
VVVLYLFAIAVCRDFCAVVCYLFVVLFCFGFCFSGSFFVLFRRSMPAKSADLYRYMAASGVVQLRAFFEEGQPAVIHSNVTAAPAAVKRDQYARSYDGGNKEMKGVGAALGQRDFGMGNVVNQYLRPPSSLVPPHFFAQAALQYRGNISVQTPRNLVLQQKALLEARLRHRFASSPQLGDRLSKRTLRVLVLAAQATVFGAVMRRTQRGGLIVDNNDDEDDGAGAPAADVDSVLAAAGMTEICSLEEETNANGDGDFDAGERNKDGQSVGEPLAVSSPTALEISAYLYTGSDDDKQRATLMLADTLLLALKSDGDARTAANSKLAEDKLRTAVHEAAVLVADLASLCPMSLLASLVRANKRNDTSGQFGSKQLHGPSLALLSTHTSSLLLLALVETSTLAARWATIPDDLVSKQGDAQPAEQRVWWPPRRYAVLPSASLSRERTGFSVALTPTVLSEAMANVLCKCACKSCGLRAEASVRCALWLVVFFVFTCLIALCFFVLFFAADAVLILVCLGRFDDCTIQRAPESAYVGMAAGFPVAALCGATRPRVRRLCDTIGS